MAQPQAEFIRIPAVEGRPQTYPVEPGKRMQDSDIRIEFCDESDAERLSEGLYLCFPEAFWGKKEPVERRPEQHIRVQRLAKRIRPSLSDPNIKWLKAVLVSTGEIVGAAGWAIPGNACHTLFRRSAAEFYGWKEKMGWTDEEMDEMWEAVDDEEWNGHIARDDDIRKGILGDEPHWHLAPLLTWPNYQGRGIGKKLLSWAIEQADATDPPTPMYLESAPTARAVYMHCGFVPQGEANMLRRGPAIVRGLEAEEEKDSSLDKKVEVVNVDVVAKEMEADLAH